MPTAIEVLRRQRQKAHFGDQLNSLDEQVTASNQDLKAAEARFSEARALVLTCKTTGIGTREVESFRQGVAGLFLARRALQHDGERRSGSCRTASGARDTTRADVLTHEASALGGGHVAQRPDTRLLLRIGYAL
jgi:hypothetical protein